MVDPLEAAEQAVYACWVNDERATATSDELAGYARAAIVAWLEAVGMTSEGLYDEANYLLENGQSFGAKRLSTLADAVRAVEQAADHA